MCSRFELNENSQVVQGRFGLAMPPPWPNRAEIRPTDLALTIGDGQGRLLRWGLDVDWDKRPLINARAETLAQRPAFRRLLGHRVLVPASAWWEWQAGSDGKSKVKMRLGRADGGLFALAGLVDGENFVIVTCAPAPAIAHVHDRMPVVLAPEFENAWVDSVVPFEQVAAALTPPCRRADGRAGCGTGSAQAQAGTGGPVRLGHHNSGCSRRN